MKNTLILKTPHKNRRLHFAETNILNDFTTWVISDEKKSIQTDRMEQITIEWIKILQYKEINDKWVEVHS